VASQITQTPERISNVPFVPQITQTPERISNVPFVPPDGSKKEPGQQKEEFEKWIKSKRAPKGYRPRPGRTDQQDQLGNEELADETLKKLRGKNDYGVVEIVCVGGMILYWVISEGSRFAFPPRNLLPVP